MAILVNSAKAQWQCGDPLVDPRDGQTYATVEIDGECWMAENLNYGTMIESTGPGYLMKNDDVIEKYCWDDDENYCNGTDGKPKYGAFYEWKEIFGYPGGQPAEPAQGICPDGWHVPSWEELMAMIDSQGGMNSAGSKLLAGGESGFDAILTGYRCTMNGGFRKSAFKTHSTYFWPSTQTDAENVTFIELNTGESKVSTISFSKSLGLCLRCIKDETTGVDEFGSLENGLQIYNSYVTNGHLIARFNSPEYSDMEISLFDVWGRELKSEPLRASAGENVCKIQISDYARGLYMLVLRGSGQIASKKVILD
ncbi:MAG: FISUMP domain-containing protein [Candidatus Kapaibacterium sp.]